MLAHAESSEPPPYAEAEDDIGISAVAGLEVIVRARGSRVRLLSCARKRPGDASEPARSAGFLSGQTVLPSGQICPESDVRNSLATRESDWPPFVLSSITVIINHQGSGCASGSDAGQDACGQLPRKSYPVLQSAV